MKPMTSPRTRKRSPVKLFPAERPYRDRGIRLLAGVDEVGVGPLAGPVVAAAVIMAPGSRIEGIDDSKSLSAKRREVLVERIKAEAVTWSLGVGRPREIDRINILQATLRAMGRAVRRLDPAPELVLVDARTIPDLAVPQEAHVKGDATFYQIACASILAKTWRDTLMKRLDARFPGYGLGANMGYPTAAHRAAIRALGPSPVHRRSFRWFPGSDVENQRRSGA